jgi:AraC-like DNA-binding protein
MSLVPPRLEQTLEFNFGQPLSFLHANGVRQSSSPVMIVGASASGGMLSVPSGVHSFVVFFQPTGFSRLFSVPMVELSHRAHDAFAVLGVGLRALQGRLGECDTFIQRVLTVEAFLLKRAAVFAPSTPMEDRVSAMFAEYGAVRVRDVAHFHGLGLRQFERKFLAQTGLQPKLYARIARFQSALDAKISWPTRPWLDIAHGLGYHDEMHLVRDFHGLARMTPGKCLSLVGDTRPPAVLAP